ncbi:hypothetical protein ROBYS_21920 [Roseobacter sp. OBYS 0001]|nr:hypothetical protein ROBYS_21920 [Roseobacter sp. OBYS 0001]
MGISAATLIPARPKPKQRGQRAKLFGPKWPMKGANTRNATAINDALLTHRKYMVYPRAACGKEE